MHEAKMHFSFIWEIIGQMSAPSEGAKSLVLRNHFTLSQLCPTQMPYWTKIHVTISTRAAHFMTY